MTILPLSSNGWYAWWVVPAAMLVGWWDSVWDTERVDRLILRYRPLEGSLGLYKNKREALNAQHIGYARSF